MADTVVLLGTISTWIAVLLALAALIGVIGPWKAVRAQYAEWNCALNAIHDTQQDYITKGYGFGRSFRFFRRARVPRLVPADISYATYGIPALIPAVAGPWTLGEIRGTKCRTGWSRICRLLEAYSVDDDSGKAIARSCVLSLIQQRRGRLVYRHGHAWLPISRHWILAIGLLGRFGDRHDGGRLITPSIRRDLEEERTILSDSDAGSDVSSASTGSSTSHLGFDLVPLSSSRRTMISGITGVIQKLRTTHRKERTLTSPLSFNIHNKDERGCVLDKEYSSLETLFWLAEGFLPDVRNHMVFSLEDPNLDLHSEESTDTEPSPETHMNGSKPGFVIRLNPSRDRPRSLRLTIEAFQLKRVQIFHWYGETATNSRHRLVPTDALGIMGGCLIRDELEAMVYAFLDLKWTSSSFLIWKKNTKLWSKLLLATTSLFHLLLPIVWSSEGLKPDRSDPRELEDYRRWKDMTRFNQRKSRDLYLLDEVLSKTSRQLVELNDLIATLLITNTGFQNRVRKLGVDFKKDAEQVKLYLRIQSSGRAEPLMATVSWNGEEDFVVTYTGDFRFEPMEVNQADLFLAALRAANRCALWTTALDSEALLDFVGSLKHIAHVA